MDLSNLKPKEDAVEIVLLHPVTGEVLLNDEDESPMTISVISSLSKKYKEQLFNMSRKEMGKSLSSKDAEFEDLYELSVDFLAEMSCGWNITLNGEKPSYSFESAKSVYDEYSWVKDQVEAGLSNASNVFTVD